MCRSRFISLALTTLMSLMGLWLISGDVGWAMPAQTCKRLIPAIAREVGVPTSLLMAISSVESRFEAYAVNHAGTSLSFESPGEALSYVEEQLSQGEDNMDIGCMQVNWQCHKDNLKSLGKDSRDLLIPSTNIRYAAKFLKTLYAELGTWAQAVAAYHSRKPDKGHRYLIKIATYLSYKNRKEKQNEGHDHDQRNNSTVPYRYFPFYRPHSALVWSSFLLPANTNGLYPKNVSSYDGGCFTGVVSSASLSPLLPH